MAASGKVLSVDAVTAKGGEAAWQVVTDYAVKGADGLTLRAIWLPRPGPIPAIGSVLSWGSSWLKGWAAWGGHRYARIGFSFDPNDPRLYSG